MAKIRGVYALVVEATLALFLWQREWFVFGIFLFEILWFAVLWLLIRMEAPEIQVSIRTSAKWRAGKPLRMEIRADSRRLLSAGILEGSLECENLTIGETKIVPIRMNLSAKSISLTIPIETALCGRIRICLKNARCYDLFGLNCAPVSSAEECQILLYPAQCPVEIIKQGTPAGDSLDGTQMASKKGKDASEVYDLREYHVGDDFRSIHWKLTGKFGVMMVKEASDSTRHDILILLDIGRSDEGERVSSKALSFAFSLTAGICGKLQESGFFFDAGLPVNGQILIRQVSDEREYEKMLDAWMYLVIPEKSGSGLLWFEAENMQRTFRRVIYVTAGTCPEAFFHLPENLDITAICVQDEGAIRVSQQGRRMLMEVSTKELVKNTFRVVI